MPNDPYEIGVACPDWATLGAACLKEGVNPDWFDNDQETIGTSHNTMDEYTQKAKDVCATCPPRCHDACFEFTMNIPVGQDYGIRAGLKRSERLALRKKAS